MSIQMCAVQQDGDGDAARLPDVNEEIQKYVRGMLSARSNQAPTDGLLRLMENTGLRAHALLRLMAIHLKPRTLESQKSQVYTDIQQSGDRAENSSQALYRQYAGRKPSDGSRVAPASTTTTTT
eukprot:CAMPEP_0115118186 /NCGR_PEP_ID=MMETSP0227-20121206/44340_1 /TAXON_ID=89957 /ORGANISM="Polarella glacialis, Strain CCMP 1383" /LENGTH=123 /DNA_ID=CAMNT_0002519405 /DNA_START=374 /DNA_END=741 /DNA_ORIENTATION=+